MDHTRALNRIRSVDVLRAALNYAIYDRTHGDNFYDPFEIQHAVANSDILLSELTEELRSPGQFQPRAAFAYFPPKNDLCDRRLIYIPIKDLTVRYAIAIVFSEQIETEIHPQCFANRRASESEASTRFTEDFSTGGWARFCGWQKERCQDKSVLIKTDISSFYDSISHEYLIDSIVRHLSLSRDSELVSLLRRILEIPVIYYSPRTGNIEGPTKTHQGLPIGDGVEGYLANLYLKDVDDAMVHANAPYGRYVDDIRLFANSRQDVIRYLAILQEQLLRKGLNLNASKTEIAEDSGSREDMLSRLYQGGSYEPEEDENAGSVIEPKIDSPLAEFSRTFVETDKFERGSDAKDFCKFLGSHDTNGVPRVPLAQRGIWHVNRLVEVISRWRGPTKHAAWLLTQTAVYTNVPEAVRLSAHAALIGILENKTISHYSRYRILHHLVKDRTAGKKNGGSFRFIDRLPPAHKKQIIALAPSYLVEPAFELNLIALYLLKVTGSPAAELSSMAANRRPGCEPLRNALALAASLNIGGTGGMDFAAEPDATPEITS